MVITMFPVLMIILGLLLYAMTEGKASECGRLSFGAGILVLTWVLARHTMHLG